MSPYEYLHIVSKFNDRENVFFYSVDFRNVKKGSHWSAKYPFGSRAYFNVEESVLTIEHVERNDAGQYKCRIDFEKFPTKNYVVNLSVVGKY